MSHGGHAFWRHVETLSSYAMRSASAVKLEDEGSILCGVNRFKGNSMR